MIKKTFLLFLFIFTLFSSNSFSQNYWSSTNRKNINSQKNEVLSRENTPQQYALASLNLNSFKNKLSLKSKNSKTIITLPNSDGKLKRFSIRETSYLAADLAVKFPMIKTYSAQGVDDPTAVAKISLGTDGFHAIILSGNEGTVYIDPYTKDQKEYIIYKRKHLKSSENDFKCEVENSAKEVISAPSLNRNANDGKLRTYKIAIACTGEYSQFHLNRQNIDPSATDAEKKAAILSAMNTTMARVNGIYERDLAMRMIIVSDNEKLIFLDATTDGLTNDDADFLIDESQQKCDNIIGDANYDIGHTFSTGGGGLAAQGLCVTGVKGRGITGSGQPISDPFDIDYVAHEIGHQLGASHTFNGTAGNCGGNIGSTSVEPGSGTTIMAYAGICSPQNVQNNSDDYFHAISIAQMWNHIQSNPGCATITDTGNNAPTANAGTDFSIPKSTPFVLKGIGTDADGVSSLTYNWEQIDTESAPVPLVSTTTKGPAFRSLPSNSSPNRYFPTLPNVINASSNEWEVLPSVERELNFSLTVRDNNSGGGSSARDNVKIKVTNAEAFTVTAPSTAVAWDTGSSQTITWNKGTTDQAPINCTKVNIRLSTDGGLTFPILLKENTTNDGTEEITIPDNATTEARILIEAIDNIFYNVNAINFTINSTDPTFLVTNKTNKQIVCNTDSNSINYVLNFDFINGFSEIVNLSATGLPTGATASFNPTTINADGDVTMTIDNLNGSNQGEYTINVEGTSNTVTQKSEALLNIIGTSFTNITTPISPANTSDNVSITPVFEWPSDSNATSYNIMVATDVSFSNVLVNETTTTNSYTLTTPLTELTKYYWHVKSKNKCGEGSNSSTWELTTEAPSYCASTFTQSDSSEFISNVTFNTINNNSVNDHTPTADDGYEDFTSISTNIKKTQDYQISVTINTAGYQDHCYVFIDWNQDFKFDNATERYDLGNKTEDVSTATLNITVPQNAILGETRMRVNIEYYEGSAPNGDGACNSDHKSEWGETEDYTIVVEEAPQPDFTLTDTTGHLSICNKAINEQAFTIDYKTLFGFNENVSFSVTGTPANTTSVFNPTSSNGSGSINLTLSNLNNATVGDYIMTVTATSASITKSVDILFNVNDNICKSSGNLESQISLTNVKFGEIDNTSTKSTGYSDFRSMTSEVIKGDKYKLTVNANSDGNKTTKTFAWIDWNQNCLFDTDEKYDLGNVINTSGATTNSGLDITIPTNALIGTTILRISTKLASDGDPNSCELNFDGEVEDYTITITPTFSLTKKTEGLSICNKAINEVEYKIDYKTSNDFNENVTLSATNTPVNSNISFNSATISSNGIVTFTVSNLNNVSVGDYTIKITGTSTSITKSVDLILSVNDNHCKSSGNLESQISLTNVKFGEIDNTSTKTTGYSDFRSISTGVVRGENYDLNTIINTDGDNTVKTYAWIDWNQNCLFDANETYDLTSNSNSIAIPEGALLGSTTLRISTKLNEFPKSCELNFNGEVEDYTINIEESFATDTTLFTDLKMYPVPTEGKQLTVEFKVKVKDLITIKLFNLTGRLIDTQTFSTVSSRFKKKIQFPKVSSGIYFIQIENGKKIKTKKIIIK
ncbi:GEVED domain-containing protein [Tenacibaculum ovolyticum]|uniref:GEVED domain-containing protein n=1 Tax=Tenacibaculum ovolyticum TaxID=104270 RepID=UPI0007ED4D50|nr:GEVED domain-containing protein [Tenacibaculum ovolyticum]